MTCSEPDAQVVKCYPENNFPKTILLTGLISVLDIVSDIMS